MTKREYAWVVAHGDWYYEDYEVRCVFTSEADALRYLRLNGAVMERCKPDDWCVWEEVEDKGDRGSEKRHKVQRFPFGSVPSDA